jgi:hypothetical protein
MYRVRAWTVRSVPASLAPFETPAPRAAAPEGDARYGWAIEPGSEAAYRAVGRLLADSVKLWFAPRPFRVDGRTYSSGAFIVRAGGNPPTVGAAVAAAVRAAGTVAHTISTGAVQSGPDLGSGVVFPVRAPRVALLGGDPVNGQSYGYAWFAFDQRLGYSVTSVPVSVVNSATLDEFNVLVVPSVSAGGLNGALGEGGRTRLGAWVRDGGVVIALDGAASWLAAEATGLSRFRARQDSAPAAGGAALPASVPGAIVRARVDTLTPLVAGIGDRVIPLLLNSDRIYTTPRDLRPGELVLAYEAADRLRLAGYIWPEVPARVAGSPALWTERVGRGRVIAFAGDPNYRDMYRGLLPLFANAVFLGGSF